MSADNDVCAACGKEGEGLKKCTSCKEVKYCNAACQRGHWVRHKKDCKKRAAEIRDEALFKEHAREECPLCLLPFPDARNTNYRACCGKTICMGCVHGVIDSNVEEWIGMVNRNPNLPNEMFGKCPFCRAPAESSDDENIRRLEKRMEMNDARAFFTMGSRFYNGEAGLAIDYDRALHLWTKAAALGSAAANYNIGTMHLQGVGVPKNEKKAKHHWEVATIGGYLDARYNLGCMEMAEACVKRDENLMRRAFRHHMIAAKAGYEQALDPLKAGFSMGHITKNEYETVLRAYQTSKNEMESDTRDTFKLVQQWGRRQGQTQEKEDLEEQLAKRLNIRQR